MVAIPRSKGCRTCVTRRVRCDQGRPVCSNCQKGNRDCQYSDELKFVNEGSKLKKKFEHRTSQLDSASSTEVSLDTGTSSSSSTADLVDVIDRNLYVSEHPFPHEAHREDNASAMFHGNSLYTFLEGIENFNTANHGPSAIGISSTTSPDHAEFTSLLSPLSKAYIPAPFLMQDQLFSVMHTSFFPSTQVSTIPEQLKTQGQWFLRLPPMTGRSKLLDNAVRSVTLAHFGRLHGSERFLQEAQPWYGRTLRQLSLALSDPEAGMAPETLAATILLSFYEMFASTSNASWIQHAGGAGALMRARGPDVHRFGFDREMFIAYRHTVIIEACQRDEPCFLAEPAWRDLSKSIFHDLRTAGERKFVETFDLAESLYENMLDLPALLHRAKHFRTLQRRERDKFPTMAASIGDLINQVQQLRSTFKAYFVKFKGALSQTGHMWATYLSHDPVIPIYYHFPNIFVGSSATGHWTINILLNFVLMELVKEHAPDKIPLYRAESRDSALEICRSVKYMLSSSFLGPFFIIFGLRISLGALQEKDERDWVISKLFEIGSTHMAMAAHIPGFEAGASMPRVTAALSGSERGRIEEVWTQSEGSDARDMLEVV